MPDTTDPAGRRANGLPAADWGALVDLDPRLSEGLLDRLAAAGVAAYVEPATAVDTLHRAVTMPSRPLDRLWVDPSRADAAREIVASEVADLSALLAEDHPGATAHGLVHPVPRSAARRVLQPPALPGPPVPPSARLPRAQPPAAQSPGAQSPGTPSPGAQSPGTPSPGTQPPGAQPASTQPPSTQPPGAQPSGAQSPGAPLPLPPPAGHPSADAPLFPGASQQGGLPAREPGSPPSEDEVFAQLVAQFESDEVYVREQPPQWPAAPDASGPASEPRRRRTDPPADATRPDSPADATPADAPRPDPPSPHPPAAGRPPVEPLPSWLEPEALEDDGHYVPPPPPPVPRIRARTLAALVSVVLGLLVLFAPAILGLGPTTGVGVLGLALLGGGAAALVWWMRDSSDSGPDDGAVV